MSSTTLKNGMTVITDHRPSANSLAVEAVIHTGSLSEQPQEYGISHFLEHMLFEGTTTRSSQEITRTIERLGGEFNAATSHERTWYYIVVPKENFTEAWDIMSDILQNPLFDEKTIEKEREVILSEIRLLKDDPKFHQWILFYKSLFKDTPAMHPVYGYAETVSALKRQDLLKYYKKHYTAPNMILTIAGNIPNEEKMLAKINSSISSIPTENPPVNRPIMITSPKNPNISQVHQETNHCYVVFGYPAPLRTEKQSAVFDVLNTLLGRGQSSRLFNEIRGKRGLTYHVGSMYEANKYCGFFAVYFSTQEKKVNAARDLALKELTLHDLAKKEVDDAKTQLIGNMLLVQEGSKERAEMNAEFYTYGKTPQQFLEEIKKVTPEMIMKAAKEYLSVPRTEVMIAPK